MFKYVCYVSATIIITRNLHAGIYMWMFLLRIILDSVMVGVWILTKLASRNESCKCHSKNFEDC